MYIQYRYTYTSGSRLSNVAGRGVAWLSNVAGGRGVAGLSNVAGGRGLRG